MFDPTTWLKEERALATKLHDASSLAQSVPLMLPLARHRAEITRFLLDSPALTSSQEIYSLTEALPAPEQFALRLLVAGHLLQNNQYSEGRDLAQVVATHPSFQVPFGLDLSVPVALICADQPQLLPTFNKRSQGRHIAWKLLVQGCSDPLLLQLAEACARASDMLGLRTLLSEIAAHERISALEKIVQIPSLEQPFELRWGHLYFSFSDFIHHLIARLKLKRRPFSESLPYYQAWVKEWRTRLGADATHWVHVEAMRILVEIPLDEAADEDDWIRVAVSLARKITISELWPILARFGWLVAAKWRNREYDCEQLVERALETRELALAEQLVRYLSPRTAKPWQKKLQLLGNNTPNDTAESAARACRFALNEGRLFDALAQAKLGLDGLKEVKSQAWRRELRLLFIATMISAGQARSAFKLLRKMVSNKPDSDDVQSDHDIVIEECVQFGTLVTLIEACYDEGMLGIEYDHPASLLQRAFLRYRQLHDSSAAMQLCQAFPKTVQADAWNVLLDYERSEENAEGIWEILQAMQADPTIALKECSRLPPSCAAKLANLIIADAPQHSADDLSALRRFTEPENLHAVGPNFPAIALEDVSFRTLFPPEEWDHSMDITQPELRRDGLDQWRYVSRIMSRQQLNIPSQMLDDLAQPTQIATTTETDLIKARLICDPMPTVEDCASATFRIESIATLAKGAWAAGDAVATRQWMVLLLEISHRSQHEPGTQMFILSELARLCLAGASFSEFTVPARAFALNQANIDRSDFCVEKAIILVALREWSALATSLFSEPHTLGFKPSFYEIMRLCARFFPDSFLFTYRLEFARKISWCNWFLAITEFRSGQETGRERSFHP